MKVVTPGQAARHTGSKYLGVLVAAKFARQAHVQVGVAGRVERRVRRAAGERLEGEGADELLRARGEHHVDRGAGQRQVARELDRLVGGDAARDPQQHAAPREGTPRFARTGHATRGFRGGRA